ncbi:hypothetical protein [Erwinia sp. V71]|uniref:hypothetical protein n=1 Tax=Erwinia sp. V71 TaxID=3369424 RepID=UPI003F6449B2
MQSLMPPIDSSDNLFHNGNPLTGEKGTIVTAGWLNDTQSAIRSVQSEIISVIEAAGMTVNAEESDQLLSALNQIFKLGDKQDKNDNLTAFSGLAGSADKLAYFTAAKTLNLATLTSAGRSLISQANSAAMLGYLGLGSGLTGVSGAARNASMIITAASATATFNADELIVETSAGIQYRLSAFSKSVNLATTGAGGMDTGSVPASGFVGLYAIYNPTSGTSALLAVNGSAQLSEIYTGANMPAGYTASALLTVVPVASSQFKICVVQGRNVYMQPVTMISTTSTVTNSQMSITGAAPLNASVLDGIISLSSTAAGTTSVTLSPSSTLIGPRQYASYSQANTGALCPFSSIVVATKGVLYLSTSNATSGTATYIVTCTGYTI